MLTFPNCKINLGLYITRKRNDGYHDIETVFYPVPVRDVLEIVPAAETVLHVTGIPVAGAATDNLVWKAYHLLCAAYPERVPSVAIYLHKVIPMGAGLGGGSADGSFMLRLVNDYCHLEMSDAELAAMALQLGSDCPFFIHKKPQFATGRGEITTGTEVDLSAYSLQVICPAVHVSTKAAFANIIPQPAPFDLRTLHQLPVEEWKTWVSNDFEAPVFGKHPALLHIKEQLYAQGAIYAAMSGTGSTIYGIFPKSHRAAIRSDVSHQIFYT